MYRSKRNTHECLIFVHSGHSRGCRGRCHKANNWPVPYIFACLHARVMLLFGMALFLAVKVWCLLCWILSQLWCRILRGALLEGLSLESPLKHFSKTSSIFTFWNLKIVLVGKKNHLPNLLQFGVPCQFSGVYVSQQFKMFSMFFFTFFSL